MEACNLKLVKTTLFYVYFISVIIKLLFITHARVERDEFWTNSHIKWTMGSKARPFSTEYFCLSFTVQYSLDPVVATVSSIHYKNKSVRQGNYRCVAWTYGRRSLLANAVAEPVGWDRSGIVCLVFLALALVCVSADPCNLSRGRLLYNQYLRDLEW
jgi:hypothetical protein